MDTPSSNQPHSIHHQKRLLRRQIKVRCHQLSFQQQQLASKQAIRRLLNCPLFRRSRYIGAYMPNQHEIDIQALIAAIWQHGKMCYLPVLHPLKPRRLWYVKYQANTRLVPNRYGILEPDYAGQRLPAQCLDLVITPLVGFTVQCQRLGMGGGFYDTTFGLIKQKTHTKPTLIGLAYDCQKVAAIPHQPWDLQLDQVMTEVAHYLPPPQEQAT